MKKICRQRLIFALACLAASGLAFAQQTLISSELVKQFRKAADLYSDPSTLAVAQRWIKESSGWDEDRLEKEYDTMRKAIGNENSELLKAAFLGTATSLFVLNPHGTQLAQSHVAELVGEILKVGPQAQIAIAEGLSRVRLAKLPEATVENLVVAIPKVESVAASHLTSLLAGDQQDRPELALIVRRSWSDSNEPTSGMDSARPLFIVQGFVRAIEANGIHSEFAVEMLEEIISGSPSPLSEVAFKILVRAVSHGSSEVKRAQLRWRNSSNERLRSLADKPTPPK